MLIINIEIMKVIDGRKMLKKQKKQRQNRTSGTEAAVKEWGLNDFVVFIVCLLLALSIILKERELNEPKHIVVRCRSLKLWDV